MVNLEAEEKIKDQVKITSENAYSIAMKAGWSHQEANRLENALMLREMKK